MIYIFTEFWYTLLRWFELFAAPIMHPELLWITIPIFLSWIAAEFFQEKLSTSLGNAISNGVVVLWVGLDWVRTIINKILFSLNGVARIDWSIEITKIVIATLVFLYGAIIIIDGIRAKEYIKFFGKIREVTYVLLMFTPVMYGVVPIEWRTFLAMALFFPIFYYVIEAIDVYTPDPKAAKKD